MSNFKDFLDVIQETLSFFEELNEITQEKLNGALQKNIEVIDSIMKKEQAALLRLKGLDRKRETIQKSLGLESLPFRKILPLLPKADQAEAEILFQKLTDATSHYKALSQSAKEALEVNLHTVDKILAQWQASEGDTAVYQGNGAITPAKQGSFTSKKA